MSPRMKTSFGVLPRDCRMIVVWEPRGRPPDVSRRPNQTTPEAVRDNQPSNNLSPSGTVRLLGWSWAKTHTTLRFVGLFTERMQVNICLHGRFDYFVRYDACGEARQPSIVRFVSYFPRVLIHYQPQCTRVIVQSRIWNFRSVMFAILFMIWKINKTQYVLNLFLEYISFKL